MTKRRYSLHSAVFFVAMTIAITAQAKSVTINNITVDVPAAFEASDYARGMEVKTEDEEVFVWFETCKGSEVQSLFDEHNSYWKENNVIMNMPAEENKTQSSGTNQKTMDFTKATWKGKPTILRHVIIGPLGSANSLVVFTLWASPEGAREHKQDIDNMLISMDAKVAN